LTPLARVRETAPVPRRFRAAKRAKQIYAYMTMAVRP